MAALKCTCPACNVIFDVEQGSGAVACPVCDTSFTPASAGPPSVAPAAAEPAAAAPALPFIELPTSPPAPPRRSVARYVALAALLLVGTGIALAFCLLSDDGPSRPRSAAANTETPPRERERERELPPAPWPLLNLNNLPPQFDKTPPAPPPRPELPAPVPVALTSQELAERVNRAIERGAIYLREDGRSMNLPAQYEGLLGLTLLECGVARTDPVIRRIAASLRQQAKEMHKTYVLSTSIFFFDRLGLAQDRPLICTFADRLILGQSDNGTWTYYCPLLRQIPPPGLPRGRFSPPGMFPGYTTYSGPKPPPIPMLHTTGRRLSFQGDHSNTQFATLALWIAQRHGADVRPSLQLVERHFREVQAEEGSWGYHPRSGGWRTSSTCAGLLGLAVGHGIDAGGGRDAQLPLRPNADGRINAGLQFLGKSIATVRPGRWALDGRNNTYTLWSIERTAVIYNLRTIGETEWYPWAAGWLIDMQNADGSWRDSLGPQVDTCFALLVLRRSNLAPDLTLALRNPTRKPLPAPLIVAKPAPPPEQGLIIAKPGTPPNPPNDGLVERPGTGRRVPDGGPEAVNARPAGPGGRTGPDGSGVNPEDERKRIPQ